MKDILIKGARVHNLKNIDLKIPRSKLIVITGLSGSGKSSLAFDTIYAEGQRRYVESLSSYARQFLEQLQKPDVDFIQGLSPTISIEQRTSGGNPRSIVATQTEIYDYLRILFARVGTPFCPNCDIPITAQTTDQIVKRVIDLGEDKRIYILAPLIRGRKGEYQALFKKIQKEGFLRVRVDGIFYELPAKIKLEKYKTHNIEVVVDRLILRKDIKSRLTDSVETALKLASGLVLILEQTDSEFKEHIFSQKLGCPMCDFSFPELEPRSFSFNSPYGACPACKGLGTKCEFDPDLCIPDKSKSIAEGAIEPWRKGGRGYIMYYRALLRELSKELGFSLYTPFKKLPKKIQQAILYGCDVWIWGKPFEGLIPHLERIFNETDSDYLKQELTRFMSDLPCPECKGQRLRKESLSVYIEEKNIADIIKMSVSQALEFFNNLKLEGEKFEIAKEVIKEIIKRLKFCEEVGLDYITLDRKSQTLSGGEAQRIKLATQLGSGLVNVIYILDEPTIGLHKRDNIKLLNTLKKLRDMPNTVIVVEHDEDTIKNADFIVDLGPGAGKEGGYVVFSGTKNDFMNSNTFTAKYLRGELKIKIPLKKRDYKNKPCLILEGCQHNNLKNITVKFPLGVFICVTGVSGSGKSSLITETLYRALAKRLYNSKEKPGKFKNLKSINLIDKVFLVDQSPIGRTPRSNPATYSGVFTYIRELFSKLPEARIRGFKPSRFSFNVKGGRCEACQGEGVKKIEMHFLPDVYVVCQECKGKRFNEATLKVKYKGYSISDVLEMSVSEAYELFENIPQVRNILKTLIDVGLGYIQLGQSATTLSGGEAQRLKLASQLRKKATGKTLYILDEPTTGLHFADVEKLINVLQRLVDKGNTVIVIEHNLDVVKCADYIIDLGPEGGDEGGYVVATGSPEEITKIPSSYTGRFLKEKLSEEKVSL